VQGVFDCRPRPHKTSTRSTLCNAPCAARRRRRRRQRRRWKRRRGCAAAARGGVSGAFACVRVRLAWQLFGPAQGTPRTEQARSHRCACHIGAFCVCIGRHSDLTCMCAGACGGGNEAHTPQMGSGATSTKLPETRRPRAPLLCDSARARARCGSPAGRGRGGRNSTSAATGSGAGRGEAGGSGECTRARACTHASSRQCHGCGALISVCPRQRRACAAWRVRVR
jgi:hypothetical protein